MPICHLDTHGIFFENLISNLKNQKNDKRKY